MSMDNQTERQAPATQDMVGMLKDYGILPTQQRLMIARVLFARHQHLSADQIMNRVNEGRDHVSKATVYNTLGLFSRNGLIREIIVDPTRIFYDPNTSNHHHFFNIDTGELTDIESEHLQLSELPELPAGTVAAGVDVIIRVRRESPVN